MKKLFIVGISAILIISLFSGCSWFKSSSSDSSMVSGETKSVMNKNQKYGFSLNLPETWGTVSTSERVMYFNGVETGKAVTLTSADKKNLITINVINSAHKKTYSEFKLLGENGKYAFYHGVSEGGYNKPSKETEDILKTFKVL